MEPEETAATSSEDGVRMGLRRAKLHWMRAGYEVVAGLGAFLDEVLPRRAEPADDGPADAPTKIELED